METITNMWEQIYYNNSLYDWCISLLIIVGALLVNQFIVILKNRVIKRMASKKSASPDAILFVALEKPLIMGIILFAIWIAASRLQLEKEVLEMIEKSYKVLVTLNITWFFARFANALIEEDTPDNKGKISWKRLKIDSKLYPIIKRTILIFIWFMGIVSALHSVGVQLTTLLGTLGIGGIAFALAAQDTVKNIFGGITILSDKPFRIGDTIKFDSTEGTVVDIGLRSTRILNYDKRLLTIPNYKLMDNVITNISSEKGRRIVMELGLTCNTSTEKMQEAMQLLRDMPKHIPEMNKKDLVVSFTNFAESALVITFIYIISKSADIYDTRTKVNMEILRSFNQAGLTFAYPSRTIYIEK